MGPTIDELLATGKRRLSSAPFGPSPREAALLLAHVLDLGEAQVLARGERRPDRDAVERYLALLERRLDGEPVAYLTGRREFFGREFQVDPRVLIPRPETEHLVEAALGLELPEGVRILDLGTGSGCLAVTLALELPGARVVAVDRSIGALAVAGANAGANGVGGRVRSAAADLARPLALGSFDLVVSNPPYIDLAEIPRLSPEIVRYEPCEALFAAESGFAVVRRLVDELGGLRSGAHLLIEIGRGQDGPLADHVAGSPFRLRTVHPDYAGIPRVAHLVRA